MTAVLRARALGRRYRKRWALADCTLDVPTGRIVGLVGPNGAGKSTLLKLASGMLAPTTGTIDVCGGRPGSGPAQLAKVGFVAQDTPTYADLSVADHLALGARLNPGWDTVLAEDRIRRIGLDPAERAGRLSGGQRAQLALTLGLAKRPELLILDEPVAALDPLARREFLQDLADATSGHRMSVVLSSHLVSDVEHVCDHIIVLVGSRLQAAGDIDTLLATHHQLTRRNSAQPDGLGESCHTISVARSDEQTTLLVRGDVSTLDSRWMISRPSLEDIVLAYLRIGRPPGEARSAAHPTVLEARR